MLCLLEKRKGLLSPCLPPFVVPLHQALPCGSPLWRMVPPEANTYEIFAELQLMRAPSWELSGESHWTALESLLDEKAFQWGLAGCVEF